MLSEQFLCQLVLATRADQLVLLGPHEENLLVLGLDVALETRFATRAPGCQGDLAFLFGERVTDLTVETGLVTYQG